MEAKGLQITNSAKRCTGRTPPSPSPGEVNSLGSWSVFCPAPAYWMPSMHQYVRSNKVTVHKAMAFGDWALVLICLHRADMPRCQGAHHIWEYG